MYSVHKAHTHTCIQMHTQKTIFIQQEYTIYSFLLECEQILHWPLKKICQVTTYFSSFIHLINKYQLAIVSQVLEEKQENVPTLGVGNGDSESNIKR